MSEGRMSQVVAQGDGLRQRLVEPQGLGDGPGDLGDLQRVGQARPVVIPLRGQEDLCLMLEPAECLAVQDPVSVPLVLRADGAELLRDVPPQRIPGKRRKRAE